MLRQNANPSFCAGSANKIGLTVIQFALSGHYFNMKDITPFCHRLPLLFLFLIALPDLVDSPCHIEEIFTNLVKFAIENFLEATDGFLHWNILALASGEGFCHRHWL